MFCCQDILGCALLLVSLRLTVYNVTMLRGKITVPHSIHLQSIIGIAKCLLRECLTDDKEEEVMWLASQEGSFRLCFIIGWAMFCIKFFVLSAVAITIVIAQDPPQDNPHRVRDILHSFGQAVKGAVSIIITHWLLSRLIMIETKLHGLASLLLRKSSPCLLQTKKGQTTIQTEALSKLFTKWLVDMKKEGLVSDEEVHQAAPEGKK